MQKIDASISERKNIEKKKPSFGVILFIIFTFPNKVKLI